MSFRPKNIPWRSAMIALRKYGSHILQESEIRSLQKLRLIDDKGLTELGKDILLQINRPLRENDIVLAVDNESTYWPVRIWLVKKVHRDGVLVTGKKLPISSILGITPKSGKRLIEVVENINGAYQHRVHQENSDALEILVRHAHKICVPCEMN
jgi:hypothetical protein